MDCQDIGKRLEDFLEGLLPEGERRNVEAHLDRCGPCAAEFASLKSYMREMGSLDEVAPPSDFLKQVHDRIESPSPVKTFFRSLFLPFHVKLPLELAAMALVVLTVVWFVKQPEPSFKMIKDESPAVLQAEAGAGKAEKRSSVEPDTSSLRQEKEDIPKDEKGKRSAEDKEILGLGVARAPGEKRQEKGGAQFRMKKGPEPAEEAAPLELTLIPGKIIGHEFLYDETREAEFDAEVRMEPPEGQDRPSIPPASAEKARVKSVTSAGEPVLQEEQTRPAQEEEASLQGSSTDEVKIANEPGEFFSTSQDLPGRIAQLAETLGGRVIEDGEIPEKTDGSFVLVEIPAENYHLFIERLNPIGTLLETAPPVSIEDRERPLRIRIQIPAPAENSPSG